MDEVNNGDEHRVTSKEFTSLEAVLKKPIFLKREVSLYATQDCMLQWMR